MNGENKKVFTSLRSKLLLNGPFNLIVYTEKPRKFELQFELQIYEILANSN